MWLSAGFLLFAGLTVQPFGEGDWWASPESTWMGVTGTDRAGIVAALTIAFDAGLF
jgi:hypothetical protein